MHKQVNNIKYSFTRTSTIVSNTIATIFLLNASFNSCSAAIISAIASRRRTASSFSLGNDEDVREKKRAPYGPRVLIRQDVSPPRGLSVNNVTGVDAKVERDGLVRVTGDDNADAAVRGSCLARKDIMMSSGVKSVHRGVRHYFSSVLEVQGQYINRW